MPSQSDPWSVAVWSSASWGEVSEPYGYSDQAVKWLTNKKSIEQVEHSQIKVFPNFRTAQYYRKHGGYPNK